MSVTASALDTKAVFSSNIETQAINLLGKGYSQEVVANAIGVDASRISQLLQNAEFRRQVNEQKLKNLQEVSKFDELYDSMELTLAKKLEKAIVNLYKPSDIIKAVTQLNALKRRSPAAPLVDTSNENSRTVNLQIPVFIAAKFTANVNNQIIEVNDASGRNQELLTIQAGRLQSLAAQVKSTAETNKAITSEAQHASNNKAIASKGYKQIQGLTGTFIETDEGKTVKLADIL